MEAINYALSFLILLSHIFIVVFLLGYFNLFMLKGKRQSWAVKLFELCKNKSKITILIIITVGTLGSLFYSEILNLPPCNLCWWQRIFFYPQLILVITAMIKNLRELFYYLIPINIAGLLIAVYHYIIQLTGYSGTCAADAVSCSVEYFRYFGYITIPVMSLTAFVFILIFILAHEKNL